MKRIIALLLLFAATAQASNVSSGGGGAAIGGAVTSGTAGSLLFVDPTETIAQDNANLFWDNTNNRLGIGITAPGTSLHVFGTSPILKLGNSADASGSVQLTDTSATLAQMSKTVSSGNGTFDLNMLYSDGISGGGFRVFRSTNTSGGVALDIFKGNNTATLNHHLAGNGDSYLVADSGNVGIGTTAAPGAKLEVTGNVLLKNASGAQPEMRLSEDPDNGTNYVAVIAPATLAGDITLTAPSSTGTIATLAGTETLTNKTLTGNIAVNLVSGAATVTLPTVTGTLATLAGTETLTNKTLSGNIATNLVSGAATITLPTVTGTLATLAGTETLTNKTLTTPIISTISNTGTVTLPTATDTLVGRATTDTLTNKTIGSPTVTGTLLMQNPSGAQPELHLSEDPDNGTNKTVIKAAASISDYTLTLPVDDGTADQVLKTDGAGVLSWVSPANGGTSTSALKYQYQLSSGTNGGASTAGSWQTYPLNTEVQDEGGYGSLASNQITLAAGTYSVSAFAPLSVVPTSTQLRVYNITDSAALVLGMSSYSNAAGATFTPATAQGVFTITATKVIELQYRVTTGEATYGLGIAAGWGTEVYGNVLLVKQGTAADSQLIGVVAESSGSLTWDSTTWSDVHNKLTLTNTAIAGIQRTNSTLTIAATGNYMVGLTATGYGTGMYLVFRLRRTSGTPATLLKSTGYSTGTSQSAPTTMTGIISATAGDTIDIEYAISGTAAAFNGATIDSEVTGLFTFGMHKI